MTSPLAPPPRRRSHLMDPNAPRQVRDPKAEQRLTRVQQWVMSALAVTTILHLSAGLVIAAVVLDDPSPGARVGLSIIAGAFGALAVAAARGIHQKPIVSWWLLLGLLPTAVGIYLTQT